MSGNRPRAGRLKLRTKIAGFPAQVYVDGARRGGAFSATGGRVSDAATNAANTGAGGSPGYQGSAPPHPLVDAPANVTVGEYFRGCLADVALHPAALDPEALAAGAAALARPRPRPERTKPIPLYFYAHSDSESKVMRDAFVGSLKDSPAAIELREWIVDAHGEDQSLRFGTKIELVLKAIRENWGGLVIVCDVDVRFFREIAPFVDYYAGSGDAWGVDAAFQRDEDRSLQVNLGFMALRCNRAVHDLFRITGEIIQQNRPGATGDQRIINRALAEPSFYGTPRLKWAVLPYELATDTVADAHTRDGVYGTNFDNWVLFHANDYGRAGMASSKARAAKMRLLDDAVAMAERRPGARAPRDRWTYVATPHAPRRRAFPHDTEGGAAPA